MAKKSKGDADDTDGNDGAKKKGKSKNGPKRLGPKTVAKPCLFGAALLAVLGAALPK